MANKMTKFKLSTREKERARIAFDGAFKLANSILKNPDFTDKLPRKIVLGVRGKKMILKSTSSKRKAKFLRRLLV